MKTLKPKLGQLVEVGWWDAAGQADSELPEKSTMYFRTTGGYYAYKGKCKLSGYDITVIGGTRDEDGYYADRTVIPSRWIKTIKVVK